MFGAAQGRKHRTSRRDQVTQYRGSEHSGTPHLSPRKQLTILGAAGSAIAVIMLAAIGIGRLTAHAEAPAGPHEDIFRPTAAQWADFAVQSVQSAPFQDRQETDGKIATNDDRTTPVFSPFTGRVTKVLVQAGQVVKKGEPLFAVQASEYVQAQNDLGSAKATLESAQVQLKAAEADENRLHELYKVDGASLKDWQAAQASLAAARAAHRSAEVALSAVQNRLRIYGQSDKEISALQSGATSHGIEPEAVVRAPVDGTVVLRQVEPGQFLSSAANGSANPVFSISDLSTVWMVANVREADAGRVRLGDEMNVRVLAFPGRTFQAKVTYIAPTVDPTTRRIAVRAEISNPDRILKPEMFADFAISVGPASSSLAVPENAVIYEGESAHVWLARPDHSLVLQQVRLGRSAEGLVEVIDGLRPGDRIATSSTLFIDRAVKAG
jgi:cobalt-zinc-cadmium efflux system membrane fusion protein